MRAARPLNDLTEQEWDAQLFRHPTALAKTLGWTTYHTLRSKGSAAGFPDRTLWRDRCLFAELKREGGKPTDRQVEVLTGLARAGAEVYLWVPSDLDEIGRVLSGRWAWDRFEAALRMRMDLGLRYWQPGSLWLPSGHRADQEAGQ